MHKFHPKESEFMGHAWVQVWCFPEAHRVSTTVLKEEHLDSERLSSPKCHGKQVAELNFEPQFIWP
jgi:hypothetical protein